MEAIALAANLDQMRVMHQAIEKGRNGRGVAEQLRPVCVTKGALNVK